MRRTGPGDGDMLILHRQVNTTSGDCQTRDARPIGMKVLTPGLLLITVSTRRVMGIAQVGHGLRHDVGAFFCVRRNRLPAALPLSSVLQISKTLPQPHFWSEH